jgi:activator of 2-hydroxyglutaryl-CoA dehydratase
MKCYLGIDIGSISTKAVIIDEKNKILASHYD